MGSSTERKQVRAFLSSTFSDFMEERDLLAKQVFPSLRQRARERGVEVVDVDLRWGITQEQSDRGETLPICLAEIDRCRPYFIGLLGDRYGWIPPVDRYSPELIEQQPWLKDHQGGTSVTELEILHGVINDPEMEGRAFFYFRDSAYGDSKQGAGWRSETEIEQDKLQALKQRIRTSGFPVVEDLADPQAIAQQIETDLWQLIDQQFPEAEKPSALEVEAARHASYRADRTGVYLGGESYIKELEEWIQQGEQRIQVSGESGSGKSALIANWVAEHEQSHPEDIVYCHHLGCSNDANSEKLLMRRLINTAAGLLEEELDVPDDYWELVAKVGETLVRLSLWAKSKGCRWIWVLDGLDKLEKQEALPWLPNTLLDGIHVVTSALDCKAKSILDERNYKELTIAPLERKEKEQLIDRYLRIFARQLEGDLKESILAHPLSGFPIFLRTLLEEMRQCGKFRELKPQLDFYLSSKTIDDLFERVLERLEGDVDRESVQTTMTALWASRAGLSETELLEITGLKPLEWAPIDISLQEVLSETNNRLVFAHDYIRIAIEDRYLPTEELRREGHSNLADWWKLNDEDEWDERQAEELPWQLEKADRKYDLRGLLLSSSNLASLNSECGSREVIDYWRTSRREDDPELDELIADDVEMKIEQYQNDPRRLISWIDELADVLDVAVLYQGLNLRLRNLSLKTCEELFGEDHPDTLLKLSCLAFLYMNIGSFEQAESLSIRCLNARERLLGKRHPDTLTIMNNLAVIYAQKGDLEQAEIMHKKCLEASERNLGKEHPSTLISINNLASLYQDKGNLDQAESMYKQCLESCERNLGKEHPSTLISINNLAILYKAKGDLEQAETMYKQCLETSERTLGEHHPDMLNCINNLAMLYTGNGDLEQAESMLIRCLELRERVLGKEHPDTLTSVNNLALLYREKGEFKQAEALYKRCLEASERLLGEEHPDTLIKVNDLGVLCIKKGDLEQAESMLIRCLEARERLLGKHHPDTLLTANNLAGLYCEKSELKQAEALYKRCLEASERLLGKEHPETLTIVNNLALLYYEKGELEQAEALYKQCLLGRESLLGAEHPDTLTSVNNLASLYNENGDLEQAEALYKRCIEASEKLLGKEHPRTLISLNNLALLYGDKGELEQAESLYKQCLVVRERILGTDHPETMFTCFSLAECLSQMERKEEAIVLRRKELTWCRKEKGDYDSTTLASIHSLAIDLREHGELNEAESLFRELIAIRQETLSPEDSDIGRALGGLAKTLEKGGQLKEALIFAQQCLDHRLQYEGKDSFYTNRNRLDLARVLNKLERKREALNLINEIQASFEKIEELDEHDQDLLSKVSELQDLINQSEA